MNSGRENKNNLNNLIGRERDRETERERERERQQHTFVDLVVYLILDENPFSLSSSLIWKEGTVHPSCMHVHSSVFPSSFLLVSLFFV